MADALGLILRLLHRKDHEIEFLEIDIRRNFGVDAAAETTRSHFEQACPTTYGEANCGSFSVDQIRFVPKAYERYVVSGHHKLGREQRPVGGSQNQYVQPACHRLSFSLYSIFRLRGERVVSWRCPTASDDAVSASDSYALRCCSMMMRARMSGLCARIFGAGKRMSNMSSSPRLRLLGLQVFGVVPRSRDVVVRIVGNRPHFFVG